MHYEILETRKRQQEEEESVRRKLGPRHPAFVYNENDFPSILQDLGSRYRINDEERKKWRKQDEDGKYMWITSKGKHNSRVTFALGTFLCLFFNLLFYSSMRTVEIYLKEEKIILIYFSFRAYKIISYFLVFLEYITKDYQQIVFLLHFFKEGQIQAQ